MTYDEAIDFWYGLIDYERRAPKASDLKLDRMRELLARLGDPHDGLRIVHVTGTKGKGSTSAMLAAILRSADYRTGLFTSPHLCDVRERIQIDGEPIPKDDLAALMAVIAPAAREVPGVTFFEVGTALGFLHFRERNVDAVVLEVGMGGRFDSTNVCSPVLSVITAIGLDHTAHLGDRVEKIAFEKAGIIKPGVPVVCTATNPEAVAVIAEVAAERDSPLSLLEKDFRSEYVPGRITGIGDQRPTVTVSTHTRRWPPLELGLLGRHQAENAAGVVTAVELLRGAGIAIPDDAVTAGLRDVVWPARLEVISRRPLVILDCAHNPGSVAALVAAIADSVAVAGKKRLIFAASSDKDLSGMAELLRPCFDCFYLTAYANNPRVVPPEVLAREFGGADHCVFADSADAWNAARSEAESGDLIVIAGSVFLAGELRPLLLTTQTERINHGSHGSHG